jgi:hypothetical protein
MAKILGEVFGTDESKKAAPLIAQLRALLIKRMGEDIDPAIDVILDELESAIPPGGHDAFRAHEVGEQMWYVEDNHYLEMVCIASNEAEARALGEKHKSWADDGQDAAEGDRIDINVRPLGNAASAYDGKMYDLKTLKT